MPNRPQRDEKVAARNLQRRYRITPDQYAFQLAMQDGVCAVCRQPEPIFDRRTGDFRRLAVDHDHITGELRGLLCSLCNKGMGKLREDPAILRAAADYIEQHRRGTPDSQ